MDGNGISVLDAEVVSHDTVDTGASIIQVVVGEDDEDGILALLSLDQNGVATEELEGLHGVVRERNDGVIIVNGIGNPGVYVRNIRAVAVGRFELTPKSLASSSSSRWRLLCHLAVRLSVSCPLSNILWRWRLYRTSLCSFPDASLWKVSSSLSLSVTLRWTYVKLTFFLT